MNLISHFNIISLENWHQITQNEKILAIISGENEVNIKFVVLNLTLLPFLAVSTVLMTDLSVVGNIS